MADEILDCGSCSAYCYQLVALVAEDDRSALDTEVKGHLEVLRRRPDGACVHLVDGRCSVWSRRPKCCRVFHCGKWFARTRRVFRRGMLKNGDEQQRRMVIEGRKRVVR